MNQEIIINDVGPRDGLQNQNKVLTIDEKLQLIKALIDAKIPSIEVGAFVSPKAVPAMAGTDELFTHLKPGTTLLNGLIPNLRGYENAQAVNVPLSSLVVAVSDTMNEKNINMTTKQNLAVSFDVLERAKSEGKRVQAYVATAWACPFEGQIEASKVLEISEKLLSAGAEKLVIADTIGAANPKQVAQLMKQLVIEFGEARLACHFHDTRAMGLANVYAAITQGIYQFDASIAGLGGCPFAPGASGNVATEDVVMMVEQMGYKTGISLPALLKAANLAIQLTGTAKGGKAKLWLEQQIKQQANHAA